MFSCRILMRLPISAARPLGPRWRATSLRRPSPSTHLSHATLYQHRGLVGNKENDEDDDDDEEDGAMEEDDEPDFQNNYFPVKLGQVFEDRYQIKQKIYWNRSSTIWFCLDKRTNRYVTLKVSTAISTKFDDHPVTRELQNYRHLQSINSTHPGRTFILPLLDTFDIPRSDGRFHRFLINPSFVTCIVPNTDIKSDVHAALQALDFLHTADMTHCCINPLDVTRGVSDERVFDDVVFQTFSDPTVIKGHPVYDGEAIRVNSASYNLPMLSGLDYSRIGSLNSLENIQPPCYQAPEVVLQTGKYSHAIDIWNLGCFVCSWGNSWNLLFYPYDSEEGDYSAYLHLAQIISLLGPPPSELLAKSSASPLLFSDARDLIPPAELDLNALHAALYPMRREWTSSRWPRKIAGFPGTEMESYPAHPLPVRSLEALPCVRDQPEEERDNFIDFIRRMLVWQPGQRGTTAELLHHPWLRDFRSLGVFRKVYCGLPTYDGI